MATLEKIVLRDGQADDRTWLQRMSDAAGSAVRSYWRGPFGSGDKELAKLFGEPAVSAGVSVNESAAFGVSAFTSAVFLISQDIASLPLHHFKNLPGGGKEKSNSRLNTLLHDLANPDTTAFNFRAALMLNALAGGNGYAEIERDTAGRPVALWNLEPSRVSMFLSGGRRQYLVRQPSGGEIVLPGADVLHLKGPSFDSVTGFDTVRLAREALGLSIAAERFGSTFFGNGSQLGGVLTSTTPMTPLIRKNLTESLESRHRGANNAHRWLLLESGVTFSEVGTGPRDSQYIELRTFQLREIARFFRIPVSMLGDLERSTFSNSEQERLTYFQSCLRPWLVNIEQELNAKLIAPLERNIQTIEHSVEGFLRADTEQRAQFYSTMLTNGAMTVNEVRRLENLPPIEGGDTPRVALNTAPLGEEQ